jgi:REP element-mobilizing transposase RayT
MNKYNPHIHHRRSIRLKEYDYAKAGLYFITICCQNKICRFGYVGNGEMILNEAGKVIEKEWINLKTRFPNIELHEYVIMPNHFHAILEIVGATLVVAQNNDNSQIGQPQGIDQNNDNSQIGQPQGIAQNDGNSQIGQPKGIAQNDGNSQTGQPQGIAQNDGNSQIGQPQGIAPTDMVKNKTIGDMVAAFKSKTTVEYIRGVKALGWQPFDNKLWQRNYYEHIIRNEQSYHTISEYINNNPVKWADDKFYIK